MEPRVKPWEQASAFSKALKGSNNVEDSPGSVARSVAGGGSGPTDSGKRRGPDWSRILAKVGPVLGLLFTRLRLAPFIVTLGMWGALRGLAKGLARESMVQAPATWLNSLLNTLTPEQRWMLVPPGVWMMLLLGGLVSAALRYTRVGRH